ncbi:MULTISPECIES: DUF6625 family protein [unclassified Butyrivibrio]|uniref:DUF6625 family protein n=1 Tax=unclassified Butyrivibrio TaxID=2639466 RepID=UPI0003FA92E9|nr:MULTISPECIES: DUF6625 family protein [unclassified Butyrivibrio]
MYKIAYIVPYFGKLPKGFKAWLATCSTNDDIDWIIITDDDEEYDYPKNVKVYKSSFEELKKRIASMFDFEICLDRPWKLCDFRPAFGEIFASELQGYDFWGYCDTDLIWGNIRKFVNEDILDKYDKIGFQGHSTVYRNTTDVNKRYKVIAPGIINYKTAFSCEKGCCFDEVGISNIYEWLHIPYYRETNFAHLDMFSTSFFLGHLPQNEDYKNRYQVFIWENGKLERVYLHEGALHYEEYMYLHFFCRPMKYCADNYDKDSVFVIYPDRLINLDKSRVDVSFVKKHGRCSALHFYCAVFWERRKKLTIKKVIKALRTKIKNNITRSNSKAAVKASIVS